MFYLSVDGVFVNGMSFAHLEYDELAELEPTMKRMENHLIWKQISREKLEGSIVGKAGLYHVFRKL